MVKPGMPGVAVPVMSGFEIKTVAIGWTPPSVDTVKDSEGLPTVIQESDGKSDLFPKVMTAFAEKGWMPWMYIPFPGLSTQFLTFIRERKE